MPICESNFSTEQSKEVRGCDGDNQEIEKQVKHVSSKIISASEEETGLANVTTDKVLSFSNALRMNLGFVQA